MCLLGNFSCSAVNPRLYVTQAFTDSVHKFGAVTAHVKAWAGSEEEWSIHSSEDTDNCLLPLCTTKKHRTQHRSLLTVIRGNGTAS